MQEWLLTPCYPFGLSPLNELYRGKLVHSTILNIPYLLVLTLSIILYSYFMPVCSIVKTITPRCSGQPGALLHEAEGGVQ